MKKRPLSKEKRIAQKLEMSFYIVLVLVLLLIAMTVFVWRPLCVGCGLPIIVYGVLHLIAVGRGWDRFYSFEIGGMTDNYLHRHRYTIVNGILWIVLGVAVSVVLLLMVLGVIPI